MYTSTFVSILMCLAAEMHGKRSVAYDIECIYQLGIPDPTDIEPKSPSDERDDAEYPILSPSGLSKDVCCLSNSDFTQLKWLFLNPLVRVNFSI